MAGLSIVLTLKVDSGCCGCKQQSSACQCNQNVTVDCRSRSLSPELRGWDELTNPSSPPKKFLTLSHSGTMIGRSYTDGVCGDLGGTLTETVSGSCSYNPATGVVTNNTHLERVDSNTPSNNYSGPWNCTVPGEPDGISATTTQTQKMRVGDGNCYPGIFGQSVSFSGSTTHTLSNEDTESAALLRAAQGVAWSDWRPVVNGCCARWEARSAGYAFAYVEAEYRLTVKGPKNGYVRCQVVFGRRPYGAGPMAPSFIDTVQVFTDADGNGSIVLSLPNDRGYETCILEAGNVP